MILWLPGGVISLKEIPGKIRTKLKLRREEAFAADEEIPDKDAVRSK